MAGSQAAAGKSKCAKSCHPGQRLMTSFFSSPELPTKLQTDSGARRDGLAEQGRGGKHEGVKHDAEPHVVAGAKSLRAHM